MCSCRGEYFVGAQVRIGKMDQWSDIMMVEHDEKACHVTYRCWCGPCNGRVQRDIHGSLYLKAPKSPQLELFEL